MGSHLMSRPPKYVQGFIDRHGRPRHYFRRRGCKPVTLPGMPWSPEFMAAYEQALAGQPQVVGAQRVKPGSIWALAASYYASAAFKAMKPGTRRGRRLVIDAFCDRPDQDGQPLGDKAAAGMKREHVVKLMAARADRPEAANALRKNLRALMQHAIDTGVRKDDPTREVKKLKSKNRDGFHSWEEAEIEQFEARHPIGTRARLAMALLLFSGQRLSDVIRMGPQHVHDGVLRVRQNKTGAELQIPIHPKLAEVIAASPTGHLAFLTTQYNRPFTPSGFGDWFRDLCNQANLRHCSAHGLRKAAARRLAEAGCSEHEIASITGHASLAEVRRYTRAANQKLLAESAMAKVKA